MYWRAVCTDGAAKATPQRGRNVDRIVVGIDLSEASVETARWASSFLDADGEAVLVHVLPGGPLPAFLQDIAKTVGGQDEQAEAEVRHRLEALAKELKHRTSTRVTGGRPAPALRKIADDLDADLVAIGPRAGRASRLGTTAEQLVRTADRPVLVVRDPRGHAPSRLLLAADASPHSVDVLRAGGSLLDHFDATATVLHVLDEDLLLALRLAEEGSPAYRQSLQAVTRTRGWLAEQVRTHGLPQGRVQIAAIFGSPIHEIAARTEAGGHDLVVMASRGLGGVRREVLGSVVSGALRAAWCPVLVV